MNLTAYLISPYKIKSSNHRLKKKRFCSFYNFGIPEYKPNMQEIVTCNVRPDQTKVILTNMNESFHHSWVCQTQIQTRCSDAFSAQYCPYQKNMEMEQNDCNTKTPSFKFKITHFFWPSHSHALALKNHLLTQWVLERWKTISF